MASSIEQTLHKHSPSSSKGQPSQAVTIDRMNFDVWAAAVREQMLAALQKRSSNS